ncbi:MAG: hypothetical protein NT049_11095 [Planctomycetota bacterium]|nr:hypothetical protein [Planctomycetota bacterium]
MPTGSPASLDHVEAILAGLVAEDAVNGRQQHQEVGPQQVRDHRRKDVVLAEANLIDADGVVLVDNRHRSVRLEGRDAVADVQVPRAVLDVAAHEQNLCGVAAVALQGLVEHHHQPRLAHGGACLKLRQGPGALGEPEVAHAGGDGAARDDHDAAALRLQSHHLVGDAGEPAPPRGPPPEGRSGELRRGGSGDPPRKSCRRPRLQTAQPWHP